MSTTGGIKVFSGNANRALAEEICQELTCDPGRATGERFSDGEFNFQIEENVRGGDVFIVQPTCPPVDAHLMELLVMLDAFRRSSAERVTAVVPYYGYGRSDKKDRPRVPIAAKMVANLLTTAGADRIVTIDPFDATAHSALGRIAVERRETTVALREFRAALAAGPVDPAAAHCDLSEALLMNGQRADAKKEVLAALEIAPTYERAQELLLRIVEGKAPEAGSPAGRGESHHDLPVDALKVAERLMSRGTR